MNANTVISAWSDPVARLSMSTEKLSAMPQHPAGAVARELSESELALSMGGHCGCGFICTVTGECTCANGISVCGWSWCHFTHGC